MPDNALAKASDKEVGELLQEGLVSKAKKKAQKAAPGMVKVLTEIAKDKDGATPASRVTAAKEVLHFAEGRPAAQKDEGGAAEKLTVVLANFVIGAPDEEQIIDVTPDGLDGTDGPAEPTPTHYEVGQDGELVIETDDLDDLDEEW